MRKEKKIVRVHHLELWYYCQEYSMKYIYSTSQILKLSLILYTFSITGSVASLFLIVVLQSNNNSFLLVFFLVINILPTSLSPRSFFSTKCRSLTAKFVLSDFLPYFLLFLHFRHSSILLQCLFSLQS